MLLKRTTAKAASTVYPKLIKEYPSVRKLVTAKEKALTRLVTPIGYPQRANEMLIAAKVIVNSFRGKLPNDKKSLLSIPYIGDYISSAILSLGYDEPFPMVDSNVNRIISRVYFGKNPRPNITKEVMQIASELLPKDEHRRFNFAMLDLGGTICLPKGPKCKSCPLSKLCRFYNSQK